MEIPRLTRRPNGRKLSRGAASPTSAFRLAAFQKQKQALELRLAGASYLKIADTLGYANKGGAHKAVMAALEKTIREPADRVRKIELERLDRLWFSAYQRAISGDVKAIQLCLAIMERRAKFQGLDAPSEYKAEVKVTHQDDSDSITERIKQYLAEYDRLAAGPGAFRGDPQGDHPGEPVDTAPAHVQAIPFLGG